MTAPTSSAPNKAAAYTDISNRLRAALAPQAGDGAR